MVVYPGWRTWLDHCSKNGPPWLAEGQTSLFVPPPRVEDESEEPNYGVDDDSGVESNQAAAAFKAIASVISSQQQRSVPVQRDLFSDNELNGEASDQILVSEDELQAHPSETEGKHQETRMTMMKMSVRSQAEIIWWYLCA